MLVRSLPVLPVNQGLGLVEVPCQAEDMTVAGTEPASEQREFVAQPLGRLDPALRNGCSLLSVTRHAASQDGSQRRTHARTNTRLRALKDSRDEGHGIGRPVGQDQDDASHPLDLIAQISVRDLRLRAEEYP